MASSQQGDYKFSIFFGFYCDRSCLLCFRLKKLVILPFCAVFCPDVGFSKQWEVLQTRKNPSLHKLTPSTARERSHKVPVWWAGMTRMSKLAPGLSQYLKNKPQCFENVCLQLSVISGHSTKIVTRVPAKLSYVMISLQPIWRVFFYKSVFSSTLWSSVGLGTEAERMYDLFSRVSATSLPSDFKGISVWISVFFWPKCISFVKQYCLNKHFVFRFFQNYEHFFLTGFWMKSHF